MSKKDYIALAAALARTRPSLADHTTTSAIGNNTMVNHISYGAACDAWEDVVGAVSDVLAADNPRFDRQRFEDAATATV